MAKPGDEETKRHKKVDTQVEGEKVEHNNAEGDSGSSFRPPFGAAGGDSRRPHSRRISPYASRSSSHGRPPSIRNNAMKNEEIKELRAMVEELQRKEAESKNTQKQEPPNSSASTNQHSSQVKELQQHINEMEQYYADGVSREAAHCAEERALAERTVEQLRMEARNFQHEAEQKYVEVSKRCSNFELNEALLKQQLKEAVDSAARKNGTFSNGRN